MATTGGRALNIGRGRQGESEPGATTASLVQEQRERQPNVLRDNFERAERALGLFVASLIPGVGERHVRAREEARRERERAERERVFAEQQESRRAEEAAAAAAGKDKTDEGLAGKTREKEEEKAEASSAAATDTAKKETESAASEEPLVEMDRSSLTKEN